MFGKPLHHSYGQGKRRIWLKTGALLVIFSFFWTMQVQLPVSRADASQSVPTVTAVSPNSGSTSGGAVVTITGTGFTGATAVKFGSGAATGVMVNSSTSITATSPAESAGAVYVTVYTAEGTSSAGQFTYKADVSVTDFGAKGNGVANDAPAFVAAINQAVKSGIKALYIPSGIYYGGPNGSYINIPANFTVMGAATSTPILKNIGFMVVSPNILIENILNQGTNVDTIPICIKSGAGNIQVSNVSVLNATNLECGIAIHGMTSSLIQGLVFNNYIANDISGFGVLCCGDGNSTLQNVQFNNCQAIKCGYSSRTNPWITGFDLDDGLNYANISYVNCLASYSWESGFHQEGAPQESNISYQNCVSQNNGQKPNAMYGDGFLIFGNTKLTGCRSLNNKGCAGYYVSQISYAPNINISDCSDTGSTCGFSIQNTSGGSISLNINVSNNPVKGISIAHCSSTIIQGYVNGQALN